jgi:hypothetical protein
MATGLIITSAVEYPEVGICVVQSGAGQVDILSLDNYTPYKEVTCSNIQEIERQQ